MSTNPRDPRGLTMRTPSHDDGSVHDGPLLGALIGTLTVWLIAGNRAGRNAEIAARPALLIGFSGYVQALLAERIRCVAR
jgi:hypothetical protein